MTVRQIVWLKVGELGVCALAGFFAGLCQLAQSGIQAAVQEFLCTCEADTTFVGGLGSAPPPPATTPPAPASSETATAGPAAGPAPIVGSPPATAARKS